MIKGKIELDRNGLLVGVEMSNSLVSKFLKSGNEIPYCPYQILKTYMTGEYSFKSTQAMKNGIYFETKLIGKNSRGETVEPELTTKGLPTAPQKRIDMQIKNAREVFKDRAMVIDDKKVQLKGEKQLIMPELDFDIKITQTADMRTPIRFRDEIYDDAIVDIKLTADLKTTFGDFAWGKFEYMDKTQAYIASYVHNLPFFYLVFDYPATNMGYRLFKVNTLQGSKDMSHSNPLYNEVVTRYHEMKETVRKTALLIDYHNSTEWETRPNPTLCVACPLSEVCEDSYKYEAEY